MTTDRVTWEVPALPAWVLDALLAEASPRPEAEVRRALGMPPADTASTLAAVDAAVEGRCAGPGCTATLTADNLSQWWCSPGCQESWQRREAGRASPGSAPVRGSEQVATGPMRWRPDLVVAFDDTGLTLCWEQAYANGLTSGTYQHADGRLFARLDDGNRWVGTWLSDDDTSSTERADEMWGRLERELGDRRRLDPEPVTDAVAEFAAAFGASASHAAGGFNRLARRLAEAYEAQEGNRAVLGDPAVPTAAERAEAYAELHVAGTLLWLPGQPADPEAPTMADLAGGVDLTPYVAPAGAQPTATWVDESHRVDRQAAERVMGPADRLRVGDRISLEWSAADGRQDVTQLRVTATRPDGSVETEPADRDGIVERFRRLGEQVSDPHGYGLAGAAAFGGSAWQRIVAEAVQAESDRLALRAVCADEAMYQRALDAAWERGWSVAQMAAAVAAGRYTEDGWVGPPATGGVDDPA